MPAAAAAAAARPCTCSLVVGLQVFHAFFNSSDELFFSQLLGYVMVLVIFMFIIFRVVDGIEEVLGFGEVPLMFFVGFGCLSVRLVFDLVFVLVLGGHKCPFFWI